jgi:hypothetical protein
MTNHIIPKTAYLADYTLSVEDFLQMWEEETGGQEGEPTQVMYDVFCRSCAQDVFDQMIWGNIENTISFREDT